MHRLLAGSLTLVAITAALAADTKYADGWTPDGITKAVDSCTDELVKGVFENSKREQGADPSVQLTDELKKQLAPQIAAFRDLCDCTVRATAEKFGKTAYEKDDPGIDRMVEQLIGSGKCTLKTPD